MFPGFPICIMVVLGPQVPDSDGTSLQNVVPASNSDNLAGPDVRSGLQISLSRSRLASATYAKLS